MVCTLTTTSCISLLRHSSGCPQLTSNHLPDNGFSWYVSTLLMSLVNFSFGSSFCRCGRLPVLWSADVVCSFFPEQHPCVLRPRLQMLDPPLQGCWLFVVLIHILSLTVLASLFRLTVLCVLGKGSKPLSFFPMPYSSTSSGIIRTVLLDGCWLPLFQSWAFPSALIVEVSGRYWLVPLCAARSCTPWWLETGITGPLMSLFNDEFSCNMLIPETWDCVYLAVFESENGPLQLLYHGGGPVMLLCFLASMD